MSRNWSPGCVVCAGQPVTVTSPPVITAAARNGAALDRSGSIAVSSARMGPGATTQRFGSLSSTWTPRSRSIATDMSRCGWDGTGFPSCRRSTPSSYRAPASSSADTNWLEPDASSVTLPPRTEPVPETVYGIRPVPRVVDLYAEGPQGAEDDIHRALPGVRVAVERDHTVGQRGDRWDEAHHGAGQAAVDVRRALERAGGDGDRRTARR